LKTSFNQFNNSLDLFVIRQLKLYDETDLLKLAQLWSHVYL